MADGDLVNRKNDHLDIVLDDRRALSPGQTGFSRYQFLHCALPQLHLDDIDLSTPLLGKTLQAPFLISSMTGGAARAKAINHHLAEAAEALGIALAIGSQRVALQSGSDHGLTRDLRQLAPSIPLLGNIGAAQLVERDGIDWARRAVEMIGADALIVHLNPLQEAVQVGGDRDWRGILEAIEYLVTVLDVPVVIKEVGAGISASVARSLVDAGVAVIDVAGAGGTSWAAVEAERSPDEASRKVAMAFAGWGIPTALALQSVRHALPDTPLIASGGIRDGVDAAKAIRLGADVVGQAAAVLQSATQSTQAVIDHFEVVIHQLRIACFCTGSADLAALRRAELVDLQDPALGSLHG
ncbi:isopentenyl-diphosphate delta-isomerase [Modicisalibacter xianhensis]|uniref:Isopentenyl-diphosphate delta-isomerase n=1 Tax=Modicisalibacter xianhensis TaxID=442341 RepID=A0A4R8FYG6_9GAMM|nr:type 2 isopentenyl-diphosphate Delta-isomerase [Halomonas xianhensis]TDX31690.1 isopentenyl-diphosphate delta-isomerase [Halomonas xianhensis]